jgi:hypothetical protein
MSGGRRRMRRKAQQAWCPESRGQKLGQFVMLPIAPDVFHRIEFRRVARQPLHREPATVNIKYSPSESPRPRRQQGHIAIPNARSSVPLGFDAPRLLLDPTELTFPVFHSPTGPFFRNSHHRHPDRLEVRRTSNAAGSWKGCAR